MAIMKLGSVSDVVDGLIGYMLNRLSWFNLDYIEIYRLKYLFGSNFCQLFWIRSQFSRGAQTGPKFGQFDSIRS